MQLRIPSLKQIIIIVLVAMATIIGIAFFIHFATHGRLVIISDRGIEQISLFSLNGETYDQHFDGYPDGDLPANQYLVRILFTDNQLYSEEVTINGFFATTTITVPELPATSYTKILDSTLGYFLPLSPDAYLSYYPFLASQVIVDGTAERFSPLSIHDAYFNFDGTMLSTTVSAKRDFKNEIFSDEVEFYYYDAQTSQNVLISNQALPGFSTVSHGQDGFYVVSNHTLYSYTPQGAIVTSLPNNMKYSIGSSGTPIVTKNSTHIAFLEGNDYFQEDPENELGSSHGDLVDTNIYVYPTNSLSDNSKRISISLPRSNNISSISISPDSKHIAVIYDYFVHFYDIATGQQILTAWTLQSIQLNDLIWITNDKAIFLNDLIFQQADLTRKSVSTILAPNEIIISEICGIKNGRLYFTAFDEGDFSQSLPAGYYADISNLL